jgi:hypothetical protein
MFPQNKRDGRLATIPFILINLIFLSFNNTIDRADCNALRRVKVAFAFDAGIGIDHVDGVAFADRLGRALGNACSARDAVIIDFHGHDFFSSLKLN